MHTGLKRTLELDVHFGIESPFVGGFVGQVRVGSVLRLDAERWERWRGRHLAFGPMPREAYGWILHEPVRFVRPIVAPGELGLFFPSPSMQGALVEELAIAGRSDQLGTKRNGA